MNSMTTEKIRNILPFFNQICVLTFIWHSLIRYFFELKCGSAFEISVRRKEERKRYRRIERERERERVRERERERESKERRIKRRELSGSQVKKEREKKYNIVR